MLISQNRLLPGGADMRDCEGISREIKGGYRFPMGKRRAEEILEGIVPGVREMIEDAEPSVTKIARKTRSAFRVLVSTVISARTKDEVTSEASERLFALADNPVEMAGLPEKRIAGAIYPAGFYNNKAKSIKTLSKMLVEEFDSKVPERIDELLQLPGVGRKTANLVVAQGFGKPAICVDTHVHRIVNRLGVIESKNPEESEYALREVLPRRHWIEINDLLVSFGKKICRPISPFCSKCLISEDCVRVGVGKSR